MPSAFAYCAFFAIAAASVTAFGQGHATALPFNAASNASGAAPSMLANDLSVAKPAPDFAKLMRPRVALSSKWLADAGDVGVDAYEASIQAPLYPVFGPPPPLVRSSYAFTRLDAPLALDLPESLHEFRLDVAWMRRVNDHWSTRFTLGGSLATDLRSTGDDAARIQGGAFALFRPNETWSFAFGALATGRDDIPVLPGIGLVWEPSPQFRANLMMPKPRVSWVIADDGRRQQRLYLGGGIDGGVWGYERQNGTDERLNYREFRVVAGWESAPPRAPGAFFTTGTVWTAEIGYAFGREFEFERAASDITLEDALLLRTTVRY